MEQLPNAVQLNSEISEEEGGLFSIAAGTVQTLIICSSVRKEQQLWNQAKFNSTAILPRDVGQSY
jgi:hypothetical protein